MMSYRKREEENQTPQGKYEQEQKAKGIRKFILPDHYTRRPLFSHPSMRLGNDYSVGIYAQGLVIRLQNQSGETSSGSHSCESSLTCSTTSG